MPRDMKTIQLLMDDGTTREAILDYERQGIVLPDGIFVPVNDLESSIQAQRSLWRVPQSAN